MGIACEIKRLAADKGRGEEEERQGRQSRMGTRQIDREDCRLPFSLPELDLSSFSPGQVIEKSGYRGASGADLREKSPKISITTGRDVHLHR